MQLTGLLMITANISIILLVVFTTLPIHCFIIITTIFYVFFNSGVGWGGGTLINKECVPACVCV